MDIAPAPTKPTVTPSTSKVTRPSPKPKVTPVKPIVGTTTTTTTTERPYAYGEYGFFASFDRAEMKVIKDWANMKGGLTPGDGDYVEQPNFSYTEIYYDTIVPIIPREHSGKAWTLLMNLYRRHSNNKLFTEAICKIMFRKEWVDYCDKEKIKNCFL